MNRWEALIHGLSADEVGKLNVFMNGTKILLTFEGVVTCKEAGVRVWQCCGHKSLSFLTEIHPQE